MTGGRSDPYYDIFEDFDLIAASLLSQYGIHIYSPEFRKMTWDEFCSLVGGLGPDTPLGRIVSVRAEDDQDVIKGFTSGQRKIWRQWRDKAAGQKSDQDTMAFYDFMKTTLIGMAGEDIAEKKD